MWRMSFILAGWMWGGLVWAGPREAVVAEAALEPGKDLNTVLANNGWTVLKLPSSLHKPGELFQPGASVAMGSCVDAAPVTGELPSIEAQGSKGFVVDGEAGRGPVRGGGGVQATSFEVKSYTNVEHVAIKGFGMKLNAECVTELERRRAAGESLAGWYVIQEAARANVKEVRCSSKEAAARVRALWAKGEMVASTSCMDTLNSTGTLAYKAVSVTDLMPAASAALAPAPVSTPAPIAAVEVSDVQTVTGGGTDIAALAARAAQAKAARESKEAAFAAEQARIEAEQKAAQARLDTQRKQIEEEERKAGAALEEAQRKRLDAAAQALQTEAARDYTALKPLVEMDVSSETRPVLEAFVKKYSGAKVSVDDLEQAVVVPGLAKVQAKLGGASFGGSNSIGMKFVRVAAGSFEMGSPSSEKGRYDDETQHSVRLTKSFLMSTTEVTQGQWRAVMGSNPSVKDYKGVSLIGNTLPVQNVSWHDAVKFANALSKKEGLRAAYRISGKSVSWDKSVNGYRLPTEAEWEYAARAGKHRLYAGTDSLSSVCRYASVHTARSRSKFGWSHDAFPCEDGHLGTAPVGSFKPNAWGLYDMTGNVWEWCWDWYGKKYGGSSTDPVGAQFDDFRVERGGSWLIFPANARVANRFKSSPDYRGSNLGLRLVRTNP